jgi:hypothetical protein
MAFGSELAIRLERGKQVPLTPKDISHETGMDRRQVRRALAALEAGGFLDRGGENIHCWVSPRPGLELAPVENEKSSTVEYPSDLPDYLLHYLRRFRPANLPDAAQLEELKPLCSAGVEIDTKIRRIMKPQTDSESRTRTPGQKSGASGHAGSLHRTRGSALSVGGKVSYNERNEFTRNEIETLEENMLLRERTERKKNLSSSSSANGKGKPMMMTAEIQQVSEAVRRFCLPELSAVDLMIRSCHVKYPNVTPAMICEAVAMKGPLAIGKKNPIGFLAVAVPNVLTGVSVAAGPRECTCGHRGQCDYCHTI